MGEIAEGLINGDFDSITGEYIGEGFGYPRTRQKQNFVPSNKKKVLKILFSDFPKGNPHNVSRIQMDLMIEEIAHELFKLPQNVKETTVHKWIINKPTEALSFLKNKYQHLYP